MNFQEVDPNKKYILTVGPHDLPKDKDGNNFVVKVRGIEGEFGLFWLSVALLIIAFGGEPDLVDALVHFLMK